MLSLKVSRSITPRTSTDDLWPRYAFTSR